MSPIATLRKVAEMGMSRRPLSGLEATVSLLPAATPGTRRPRSRQPNALHLPRIPTAGGHAAGTIDPRGCRRLRGAARSAG
ncbi:hypothetical protein C0J29_20035 [Mycobacterium paragordonae]|nr:hypothetical protein C0J29_20035 [Mycobacterium paragordonae]